MSTPSCRPVRPVFARWWAAPLLVAWAGLSGCGGGGGGGSSTDASGGTTPTGPTSSAAVAQQCSANNPYRGDATATTTLGSLSSEKRWLRAYLDEVYLWYAEIPSVDASLAAYSSDTSTGFYTSIDNYFEALKTPALSTSGRRKDQFSFTYPTRAWADLSQSGVSAGYGIEWSLASSTPPRGIRIAYVEPNSPAAQAGLQRGDTLVSVDAVGADDGTAAGVAVLNDALFPDTLGAPHSFVFSRSASTLPTVTLTSANVTKQPVLTSQVLNVAGRTVGYMVFNDHIATAEPQLLSAIQTFRNAAVQDLVLDLRYNGGGYLYIASQLAYMIAGPGPTAGKVFEQLKYNDKRVADNNAASSSFGFYDVSCNPNASLTCTTSQALPSLNLPRVYVLVGGSTCSASESIVNSLRGVDIDVRLIGASTCGKPYGFTPKDNCGISYFPIEFQGVNAKGFGDYADGFTPQCAAADDLNHALGDPAETRLSAALTLLQTGACPPAPAKPSSSATKAAAADSSTSERFLVRQPTRENRLNIMPRGLMTP